MGDMLNMAPKRLISPLCDSYLTPANLSYSIKEARQAIFTL
ncbi:unnamed protein product [marine sediment metagenome]|uniref:Uncharacterized protein n=1 Tax=marine sediment metagenome TaxID=412755 RepID=X1RM71_9ZZZZ